MEVWQDSVSTLAEVARQHPQTAYMGLQKSLRQEWAFVQCVTLDTGIAFQMIEDVLQYIFLPDLFQGETSQIPGRAINSLLVKQAGIALSNPTRNVRANWTASCVITGHLVAALRGTAKLRSDNHALLMGEHHYDDEIGRASS